MLTALVIIVIVINIVLFSAVFNEVVFTRPLVFVAFIVQLIVAVNRFEVLLLIITQYV